MLSEINKHERDQYITMEKETHKYTINGYLDYISTTTFIKMIFPPLSEDFIIYKILKSSNIETINKYKGMNKEQIKAKLNIIRDASANLGSALHEDIENFYNNIDIHRDDEEWTYFTEWRKTIKNKQPYRTEWMIYDDKYKICGTIDMVFKNEDGTYDIMDWKRSKNISNPKDKYKHTNTNYWHYAYQLNVYKYILENNYNITIKNMVIVQLHPDNKTYKTYNIDNLQPYIVSYLKDKISVIPIE
jgi:hypothetical protein